MKVIELTDDEVEMLISLLENFKRGLVREENWDKMFGQRLDYTARVMMRGFVSAVLPDVESVLSKLYKIKEGGGVG